LVMDVKSVSRIWDKKINYVTPKAQFYLIKSHSIYDLASLREIKNVFGIVLKKNRTFKLKIFFDKNVIFKFLSKMYFSYF
jgi:hypothetical protein